ncbi:hypothetical protein [Nocardia lijiangensis]|uniref:hypothetical protein n=1 Tax=Nocardia lijiangensis TaxID=299618 RepID=UPI0008368604|nr:hypothetical protein [Nocardia lijiangensis]
MTSPDEYTPEIPLDSWTIDDLDVITTEDIRLPLHESVLVELAARIRRIAPATVTVTTEATPPELRVTGANSTPILSIEIAVDTGFMPPLVPAPHYWRIGLLPLAVAVYVKLPTGEYELTDRSTREIRVTEPFALYLPLPELWTRGSDLR